VDNAREQRKPKARKMLENAARHEAAVPSVQQFAPTSVVRTGCIIIPVHFWDALLAGFAFRYNFSYHGVA